MPTDTLVYEEWVDFGPSGIPPGRFGPEYSPEAEPDLPPQAVNVVNVLWAEKVRDEGVWPGSLLNLESAGKESDVEDIYSALLGPTRFDEYVAARRIRDGDVDIGRLEETYDGIDLADDDLDALREEVRPLSTFPAVLTADDRMVMGVKTNVEKAAGKVSYPGAAYLDHDENTVISEFDGRRYVVPSDALVTYPIEEEMEVTWNDISEIHVTGIWEDVHPGAHFNPGLFSVVHTSLDQADIEQRWGRARDADEHSKFVYVPAEESYLEDVIASMVDGDELPADTVAAIDGLPDDQRVIQGTGKSTLMPFMVGRQRFGDGWYEDQVDAYRNQIDFR